MWGTFAGKIGRQSSLPVHPHVCGEHYSENLVLVAIDGSSPTRVGNIQSARSDQCLHRFIPTRVGNILKCTRAASFRTVHPHACGEHAAAWDWCARPAVHPRRVGNIISASKSRPASIGSSPRVWGTLSVGASMGPYHAVHPHACGKHVRRMPAFARQDRFIPTRVGNIFANAGASVAFSVHPHACGEHPRRGRLSAMVRPVHPHAVGNIM